jgi:hypothetical protein
MTTAIRIIPAPVKRLNAPDRIIPSHRRIENERISLKHTEPDTEKLSTQKILDIQKQRHLEQFKNWCMPELPDGYIKASRFDPL